MKKLINILLVMLISLTLVGCGVKTEAKPSTPTTTTSDKILSNVDAKKVVVTVTKTERTKDDEFDELKDGKELVLLYVKITNNTDKEIEFNPTEITMETPTETLSDTSISPKGIETMSLRHIESGKSFEGIVSFEVNIGETFKVYYKSKQIK